MNDDVVEAKSARDRARRWSHLLEAGAAAAVAAHSTKLDNANDVDDDASLMFDCTDLIVPTSHELINREVELGIRRWHDLASRVIMDDNDGEERQNYDDDDDDEGGTATMMMPPRQRENDKLVDATSGGDKRKQRTMPYNFDYACKGNNGGPTMIMTGEDDNRNNGNIHKRPRVISLLDPTRTLDYEDELYHTVFRPIHTLDELEGRYALGREKIETHAQVKKKMMTTTTVKQRPGRPPNAAATAAASSVVTSPLEEKDNTRSNNNNNDSNNDDNGVSMQLLPHHGCQHTYAVKRNLREWFAKYSRIDAHSLGRLRVRDRHSAPPFLRSNNGSHTTTTTTTYVRFEILRHSQNLKRGSGVDNSRLEVELHGTQRTLLDLHRVIVESALNKEADGVDSIDNDVDENNTSVVNGIFFIENTFYTCGQVGTHVAEAITCWLDEDSNNVGEGSTTTTLLTSRRRKFLGMLPNALLPSVGNSATRIIPMSEIKLEDVSLRLGVRYFHMFIPQPTPSSLRLLLFHGQGHDEVDDESSSRKTLSSWSLATESAVFVTGIHTIPLSESLSKRTDVNNERKDDTVGTKHPILIHDTWAAPQRHICYACNHSPASVVTVNDELTDSAPPGLDDRTNKIYLQGVPLCSSCYRAMHYCRHDNTDDGNRGLKLRPSENDHAFLVLSIEEYDRLVTLSSLDDSPANAGF